MQNTANQRIKTRLTFPNPPRVTYLCSGNNPTNDLVTEILLYSALFCFFAKWKNKANKLILNRLRFVCPISLITVFQLIIHLGRHTFATLLITKGADVYTVSKLLGHTDITTTQIYAKVVEEKKKDAISLLD